MKRILCIVATLAVFSMLSGCIGLLHENLPFKSPVSVRTYITVDGEPLIDKEDSVAPGSLVDFFGGVLVPPVGEGAQITFGTMTVEMSAAAATTVLPFTVTSAALSVDGGDATAVAGEGAMTLRWVNRSGEWAVEGIELVATLARAGTTVRGAGPAISDLVMEIYLAKDLSTVLSHFTDPVHVQTSVIVGGTPDVAEYGFVSVEQLPAIFPWGVVPDPFGGELTLGEVVIAVDGDTATTELPFAIVNGRPPQAPSIPKARCCSIGNASQASGK